MKKLLVAILLLLFCILYFAFPTKSSRKKLLIGASPVPHAEILNFVKEDLKNSGIDLEIVEFMDYITPNTALNEKQIDANFFQHQPYLDSFAKDHQVDIVPLISVHTEPLGLYSQKIRNINELKDGAVIAIPNDPTNEGRALQLLQSNNIIKLKPNAGAECTTADIICNPKNLRFKELEAAQLPRVLDDVDGVFINGHYAIESKLNPRIDALILEGTNSPYANVIAIRREMLNDPILQELIKRLRSDKVKQFILHRYKGGVAPAF